MQPFAIIGRCTVLSAMDLALYLTINIYSSRIILKCTERTMNIINIKKKHIQDDIYEIIYKKYIVYCIYLI